MTICFHQIGDIDSRFLHLGMMEVSGQQALRFHDNWNIRAPHIRINQFRENKIDLTIIN